MYYCIHVFIYIYVYIHILPGGRCRRQVYRILPQREELLRGVLSQGLGVGRRKGPMSATEKISSYTPHHSSIKGLMVSIRWYLGYLEG